MVTDPRELEALTVSEVLWMIFWFLVRFFIEGALFLLCSYLLFEHGYAIFTDVRLEPREDRERFWQKRYSWTFVKETILVQE